MMSCGYYHKNDITESIKYIFENTVNTCKGCNISHNYANDLKLDVKSITKVISCESCVQFL